jgi:transposase
MIRHSKRLYRERNRIERMFGHLKINRAIATRYDQLADSFLGMLFLASARYWLKFVHAAGKVWCQAINLRQRVAVQ